MNGFEVIKVVFPGVVETVTFDSASWKSKTSEKKGFAVTNWTLN